MLKPDSALGRIRYLRLPLLAKMLILLVPLAVLSLIVVGTVNIHHVVDADAITASEFDLRADKAWARGFSQYMLKPSTLICSKRNLQTLLHS